jgi:hypothetical protein
MSEILGTLFKYLFAIVGVGAILAVLSSVVANHKTGTAAAQIDQLVANTQQLYAGQNDFTSLTSAVLIDAGAVPSGMATFNYSPVSPWGSAVTFSVHNGDASSFDVSLTGVPSDSCAKLAGAITNFSAVVINAGATLYPPVDAAQFAIRCAVATPATLVFTFSGS